MPRTPGRSPEDTRRLVLDAAAHVIRDRGVAATLDDIASQAGVSKGGLLYHFASKDELILALAADAATKFRNAVHASLDLNDHEPGRLTRAYIRASLDPRNRDQHIREEVGLIAQLSTRPDVTALLRADADRWRADLDADGLPPDISLLVISAADGASTAPVWGATSPTPLREGLKTQLLALTRSPIT